MSDILIEDLSIRLGLGAEARNILDAVSFAVRSGESFGLVGESGSGKSTILKCIGLLLNAWTGRIEIGGKPVRDTGRKAYCRDVQMVFQDPYGSLHPRQTVDRLLLEPLAIHGFGDGEARIVRALDEVGLGAGYRFRYPHQLSGGQRQRVAIARALLAEPRILILDDATSSVDATTESEIKAALAEVMQGRTTFVIAHRLSTIALADEVVVLEDGEIAARGTHDELLETSELYREIAEKGLPDQVFLTRCDPDREVAGL